MPSKKGLIEMLKYLQINKLGISKDGKNPHFRSKYTTLDNIREKIDPVLSEFGVYVYHEGTLDGVKTVATDGEFTLSSFLPFEEGLNAQKIGAATTYYRRYNLCLIFDLLADADDDGNSASGLKRTVKKETKKMTHAEAKDDFIDFD